MLIPRPIVVASHRKVREDLSFDELMLLGEGSCGSRAVLLHLQGPQSMVLARDSMASEICRGTSTSCESLLHQRLLDFWMAITDGIISLSLQSPSRRGLGFRDERPWSSSTQGVHVAIQYFGPQRSSVGAPFWQIYISYVYL